MNRDSIPLLWLIQHLRTVRSSYFKQRSYRKRWPTCRFQGDCRIGTEVSLGEACILNRVELSGPVSLGRNTLLNKNCMVQASLQGEITIGSFCSLAQNCFAISSNHPMETISTFQSQHCDLQMGPEFSENQSKPISIGSDVWIGANAIILPGANIGHGCVIGAGSVVTGSLAPYSVAVGVPSKPVRNRFDAERIDLLLASEWWNKPDRWIADRRDLFSMNLSKTPIDLLHKLLGAETDA